MLKMNVTRIIPIILLGSIIPLKAATQPPPIGESAKEPVKYIGAKQTDKHYFHGGLRHAVGVHRYQALRANREYPPEVGSEAGWTYNHQPNLAYWNDLFYLHYMSNRVEEHLPPSRTLLMTSKDGRHWSQPVIIFPEYELPEIRFGPEAGWNKRGELHEEIFVAAGTKSIMHQRMGFYIAPDGRMLTLAFYSFLPHTRLSASIYGLGLGNVVREVYKDGTFGPIYFIRYNTHAGWNENNTKYPFYKRNADKGFVDACDALLKDKLMTLQWWEMDRSTDGFYPIEPGDLEPKALSYYHRPDGVVVGLWKNATSALTDNEGRSWTDFAHSSTLKTCFAKIWGQRSEDGLFALVYNHSATRRNRFPLVVMTGEDGHIFDNMLCLHGEVPPMRYQGIHKNIGPQYIRGIMEKNGDPPGKHMWNTYSMNKEDMWVSRTHLPISGTVENHVNQNFDSARTESDLELWNFHIPQWAPISVLSLPGSTNRVLELRDEDPYDYALAERAFPVSQKATVEFQVLSRKTGMNILEFEIHDQDGRRALRLRFEPTALTLDLMKVEPRPLAFRTNHWHRIKIEFDCEKQSYDLWVNDELAIKGVEFASNVESLERMVFRTGSWRGDVRMFILNGEPGNPGLYMEDLPGASQKTAASVFWIDNVKTHTASN